MTEQGHAGVEELQRVLDEVFHDHDRVTRREVYGRASEHLGVPAAILAHLNELPMGPYTRPELTEAINDVIRGRGEQEALGLLTMPR
ncbi:hypothetical protein DP939_15310 [Spongiactinospora rosea]|uniref:Uncharacterized protein n=1 Tax=Spongiactinospora rosea TaxID=2248750 RepID=A0A366LZ98_9ACTN|nr:hypothetical protein [Spongiactinospora rosea]RBQ19298.1 hypothetical protein DP939_15310 [Spongiactinospora rosea]